MLLLQSPFAVKIRLRGFLPVSLCRAELLGVLGLECFLRAIVGLWALSRANLLQSVHDRQAHFWRRRPDGFAVNKTEHYHLCARVQARRKLLRLKEWQRVAELQNLAVTQGLKKIFKDTQCTVEQDNRM
jgi:hypothetical protein